MNAIPRPPDNSCTPECRECGEGVEYFDEDGSGYCWDCGPIWTKAPERTRRPDETEECVRCGEPMVPWRVSDLCGGTGRDSCRHAAARDALPGGGWWQRWDGEWVCQICHPRPTKDGPLVPYAVWELGLRIVGRGRWK